MRIRHPFRDLTEARKFSDFYYNFRSTSVNIQLLSVHFYSASFTSPIAYFVFCIWWCYFPHRSNSLKSGINFIKKSWYVFEESHWIVHNLSKVLDTSERYYKCKRYIICTCGLRQMMLKISPWFFWWDQKAVSSINCVWSNQTFWRHWYKK